MIEVLELCSLIMTKSQPFLSNVVCAFYNRTVKFHVSTYIYSGLTSDSRG